MYISTQACSRVVYNKVLLGVVAGKLVSIATCPRYAQIGGAWVGASNRVFGNQPNVPQTSFMSSTNNKGEVVLTCWNKPLPLRNTETSRSGHVMSTERVISVHVSHPAKRGISVHASHPANRGISVHLWHPANRGICIHVSHPAKRGISLHVSHPAKVGYIYTCHTPSRQDSNFTCGLCKLKHHSLHP